MLLEKKQVNFNARFLFSVQRSISLSDPTSYKNKTGNLEDCVHFAFINVEGKFDVLQCFSFRRI